MKRILSLTFVLVLLSSFVAQAQLNFGLSSPQPESNLPKSKAPRPICERKEFVAQKSYLAPTAEGNFVIEGGWQMIEDATLTEKGITVWDTDTTTGWYNATVPGTVLTTLVEQGVYPDPYYGLNNLYIPESLCRQNWWYRVSFDTPQIAEGELYTLLFNGINYKAEVWLNGARLGDIAGAFTRASFPVSTLLKQGEQNTLVVKIIPPHNPGIPHEQEFNSAGPNGGVLCMDGPTFICTEGWDWVPGIRDRNIGIWQSVELQRGGSISLTDPFVITDLPLPDTSSADITIRATLKNSSSEAQSAVVKGKIGDVEFSKSVTLEAKEQREVVFSHEEFAQLHFIAPRLWWPNGYGEQNLYTLELSVEQGDRALQREITRFGVRELSYELMARNKEKKRIRFSYNPTEAYSHGKVLFDYRQRKMTDKEYGQTVIPVFKEGAEELVTPIPDSNNPHLVVCVNGVKIFCKGGNWGMDDAMKRCDREHLEPYFRLHKDMNFTMVRNWTGESTEEVFYELCDEYGMLVWNDFSMSTGDYNLEPIDAELFMANATEIVRRYRNHPSIAVWGPRNEGYAPNFLEDRFQELFLREDGTRHYHANSRLMNLCQSGPWGYFDKYQEFTTNKAQGFTTELGAPAMPTAETVRKFIAPEDLWPIGDVWYYHDLHQNIHGWQLYIAHINALGDEPAKDVDEFCERAQWLNYEIYRNMFEAWNHKMWQTTSGLLLWMSHPAWPSVIWQTYSYDYETPAPFFGSKKACEPTHIQWNATSHRLQVINASCDEFVGAKATFTIYDHSGKALWSKQWKGLDIVADNLLDIEQVELPATDEPLVMIRLKLQDKQGRLLSENDYWVNPKEPTVYRSLDVIGKSRVESKILRRTESEDSVVLMVELRNRGENIALNLKTNVRSKATGEAILPAYASDGYFNLLPAERKRVSIEVPKEVAEEDMMVTFTGLNIE